MTSELVGTIKASWGWTGINPAEVVSQNEFGNLIIRDVGGKFWRLCPEDVYCEVVANDAKEMNDLLRDPEFMTDWQMLSLVKAAKETVGPLGGGRKYCLAIPGALGGAYDVSNIKSAPLTEMLIFSGNLGKQIRDLPDGTQVELKVVD